MEAGHNPKKNVLENKSLLFALRIINAYKYIHRTNKNIYYPSSCYEAELP